MNEVLQKTGRMVEDDIREEVYTPEQIEDMSTEQLLLAYKRTGLINLKWSIVLRYQELIKRIALQIRGIYSSFAQVDDIISEGVITLMSSVDKFDPDKGVKFETFIAKRIRGMIIDLARRQDWMPRSVRKRAREIDQTTNELYTELGRYPTDGEIAERLGITQKKYQEDIANVALCNVMSLEALFEERQPQISSGGIPTPNGMEQTPEQVIQDKELQTVLAEAIRSLRENEQLVLALYYQKDLNMKKIAQVMGVSGPRVSQIHTKAVQKLRIYLSSYMSSER